MSSEFNVYVGPYLKTTPTVISVPVDVRRCPNRACGLRASSSPPQHNFCPACGASIVAEKELREDDSFSMGDLMDEIDDKMVFASTNGADYWMVNLLDWNGREVFNEGQSAFAFTPKDVEQEIDKFLAEYRGELEKIEAAYGEDKVEVAWGVVTYYS